MTIQAFIPRTQEAEVGVSPQIQYRPDLQSEVQVDRGCKVGLCLKQQEQTKMETVYAANNTSGHVGTWVLELSASERQGGWLILMVCFTVSS